jgi:hypothetical protein
VVRGTLAGTILIQASLLWKNPLAPRRRGRAETSGGTLSAHGRPPSGAYRRIGRRGEAHEHLATATTMCREMGMTFWLAQTGAELQQLV